MTDKIKDLTRGNLSRHLYQLALPIMGTSFVQIAYSFTDMIWLGRLSSQALAAVGAAAVFAWIVASVSMINKTGAEVTISQRVGAGRLDEAKIFASHNVLMSLLISLVMIAIYALGAGFFIDLYSLEPEVRSDALSYLYILLIGFPEIFLTAALTGIYNAIGDSKTPFRISFVGLGMNMLLDPLFIHVFHWGVPGAAIATVASQGIVFLFFLYQVRRDKLFGGFPFFTRLQGKYVRHILHIGVPPASLQVLFAFVSIYMGGKVSSLGGHIGVATMTSGAQIESLTWNTASGVTTALTTIVGQNFAAGRLRRVHEAFRRALTFTLSVGLVGTLLFVFFGESIFQLIVPEEAAYKAGAVYLGIVGLSQMFMMLEITTEGLFYGLGRTYLPAGVSIVGTYLRIPMVLLFASWGWGIEAVWWAISISSMLKGLAMGYFFLRWRQQTQAQRLAEPDEEPALS